MSPRILAAALLLLAAGAGPSRAGEAADRVTADAAGVVVLRGSRVEGPVPAPEPPPAREERRATRDAPEVTVVLVSLERPVVYTAPAWGVVPFSFFRDRHPHRRVSHTGIGRHRPGFGHRGAGRGFGGSVRAGRP